MKYLLSPFVFLNPISKVFYSKNSICLSQYLVTLFSEIVFFTNIALIKDSLIGFLEEDWLEVEVAKKTYNRKWPPYHLLCCINAPHKGYISKCSSIRSTLNLNLISIFSFCNISPISFHLSLIESSIKVNNKLFYKIFSQLRCFKF